MPAIEVKETIHLLPKKVAEIVAVGRAILSVKTDEKLQQQINIGNDHYTMLVDSRKAFSRQQMYYARKSIRISFFSSKLIVELAPLLRIMRQTIHRTWPFDRTKSQMAQYVVAWLNEPGLPPKLATGHNKLPIRDNQYITIGINIPGGENLVPLANSIRTGKVGKGIFYSAAGAMRRQMAVTRNSGRFRIAAVRMGSSKTNQPLKRKEMARDSKGRNRHIPYEIGISTNWYVVIELRRDTGNFLRG